RTFSCLAIAPRRCVCNRVTNFLLIGVCVIALNKLQPVEFGCGTTFCITLDDELQLHPTFSSVVTSCTHDLNFFEGFDLSTDGCFFIHLDANVRFLKRYLYPSDAFTKIVFVFNWPQLRQLLSIRCNNFLKTTWIG